MEKLAVAMVGGGSGAFIGQIHRLALGLSQRYDLRAACLASDASRALSSAAELGLSSLRNYRSYQELAAAEAARTDGVKAVIIVTPNHTHFEIAACFLRHKIAVICDKPLCISLAQASQLRALSQQQQTPLWLTYNYTAYPMVREARQRVEQGELGQLRLVKVEYQQDWLSQALEQQGQKQASWRTNPELAGPAGCLGDIGSHAYNLAAFITLSHPSQILAELSTQVAGRQLDDMAQILMRYANGGRGQLLASQVSCGKENHLRIEVYGSRASLCWDSELPEQLELSSGEQPRQILRRARPCTLAASQRHRFLPAGHSEGFLEAFAQLYADIADELAELQHHPALSTVETGWQDMAFIQACLDSQAQGNCWQALPVWPCAGNSNQ